MLYEVITFPLEFLGGPDPFPGGGNLDENPLPGHPGLLVKGNQLARLGQGPLPVEGEAGIHLGGDAPRNDLQDLAADGHDQPIGGPGYLACQIRRLLARLFQDVRQQGRIFAP